MIQEEKENTSLRAEEIECRVGGDGLGGRFRSMSSLPPSHGGGSSVGGSPPGSGHSTPRRVPRSPNREMDRMGVMTPMRSISRLGLRGTLRGVECPEPGGDPPTEDPPPWEGGRELMERKRPPRPSPPTRHSISSARREVFSFSSWIILRVETIGCCRGD